MNEEKIRKGKQAFNLRLVKKKFDGSKSLFGLEKIPIECLYKEALMQIGEQTSYIQELEAKVQQTEKDFKKEMETKAKQIKSECKKEFEEERRMAAESVIKSKQYLRLSIKIFYTRQKLGKNGKEKSPTH